MRIVFDAAISGSNVNINFYKAIDQEAGLDSIQTALVIEGLQTDADGTTGARYRSSTYCHQRFGAVNFR